MAVYSTWTRVATELPSGTCSKCSLEFRDSIDVMAVKASLLQASGGKS